MSWRQYKVLIIVVIASIALFLASPALTKLLATTAQTEQFTEFSLLGPNHDTKTYPFSIKSGSGFKLYLNIENHLGTVGNYLIQVKFRDQAQSAPNSFNKTSSSLPSLWDIKAVVNNQENLEIPITVALIYSGTAESSVTLTSIVINGYSVDGRSTAVYWDSGGKGFFGNLFFELWLFNNTTNSYEYNQRYVGLWLDLTI